MLFASHGRGAGAPVSGVRWATVFELAGRQPQPAPSCWLSYPGFHSCSWARAACRGSGEPDRCSAQAVRSANLSCGSLTAAAARAQALLLVHCILAGRVLETPAELQVLLPVGRTCCKPAEGELAARGRCRSKATQPQAGRAGSVHCKVTHQGRAGHSDPDGAHLQPLRALQGQAAAQQAPGTELTSGPWPSAAPGPRCSRHTRARARAASPQRQLGQGCWTATSASQPQGSRLPAAAAVVHAEAGAAPGSSAGVPRYGRGSA